MKKNINGVMYVQKIDINFLHSLNLPIPNNDYTEKFINGEEVIDSNNDFEFVMFDDKEAVKYFDSLDWIFDFNYMESLSTDKLIELRFKLMDEKDKISNELAFVKNNDESNFLLMQSKIIDLQLYSLDNMLMFVSGCIYCKIEDNHDNNYKSSKGIVRLVKSLFNSKR